MSCTNCGKPITGNGILCKSCKVSRSRKRRMLRALDYKGGECQICGYRRTEWSLSFHHVDPDSKDKDIRFGNTMSWKRMQPELDKCILVCSNCHGEIHAGLVIVDEQTFAERGLLQIEHLPEQKIVSWEKDKGPKRYRKESESKKLEKFGAFA